MLLSILGIVYLVVVLFFDILLFDFMRNTDIEVFFRYLLY